MKTFKKILCTLLVVVVCLTSAPLQGFVGMEWPSLPEINFGNFELPKLDFGSWFGSKASAADDLAPTGQCGDNVYWNYDRVTGKLIISGTGSMWDHRNGLPSFDSYIKSVVLENGVTSISDLAFNCCSNLTSITIPESVTSIGSYAFYACYKLANITVNSNNNKYSSDSNGVLYNKNKTVLVQYPCGSPNTSYTIPNSVTTICDAAFAYCDSLTSITISDSVSVIGEEAFAGSINLTSIIIPDSVAYIGEYVFSDTAYYDNPSNWENNILYIGNHLIEAKNTISGSCEVKDGTLTIANNAFRTCRNLTNVTLPDSLISIGDNAFQYCENLLSISIPNSVTNIGDGVFAYCTVLEKVTFPDNISAISDEMFMGCDSLRNIEIPNTVEIIGNYAYAYAGTGCKEITIPDSVKTIGEEAFSGSMLESVDIPDSVVSIGEGAFSACQYLTNVYIGKGTTTIGAEAFLLCEKLTNITVDIDNKYYSSDSVGVLFNKDKSILIQYPIGNTNSSYTIPDSVIVISEYAFYCCFYLNNLTFGSNVKTIEERAFCCAVELTDLIIPDSVEHIGKQAFYYCDNLTNLKIGNGVTTIEEETFSQCYNLTNLTIGNSVKNICGLAFWLCKNLQNLIIPDSVIAIKTAAFSECEKLNNVTIGRSVKTIDRTAFSSCDNLSSIIVDENNNTFSSDDRGVLFNKDKTILIQYPYGNSNTTYTIPDSVITIGERSFEFCNNLRDVIIGNNVVDIGNSAFSYSTLERVDIPDNVKTIGAEAFSSCDKLSEVVIGNKVETIGQGVFYECNNLVNVTLGYNVKTIDAGAFEGCNKLENVVFPNGLKSIGFNAFNGCSSFTNIIIPNSVTTIGGSAFAGCNKLENVTLPDGIKTISASMFHGCDSLRNIDIPDGVVTIEDNAFSFCFNLESVTIPNSVTKIENLAFPERDNLTDVYYEGTEAQWKKISIGRNNDGLTNATIHVRCNDGAHKYVSEITKAATCTELGEVTYTCFCGETYIETLPKKEHTYISEVVENATCTETGKSLYRCICGDYYYDILPADGHKFDGFNCTECNFDRASGCTDGDVFQFGSYPQTVVSDSLLISKLNELAPNSENWNSYKYYSSGAISLEKIGTMRPGDWMKYIDVSYNGEKYRGVKIEMYRPSRTYYANLNSSDTHFQSENQYASEIYWFKYEPINWRILDANIGFVVCDTIIDSQPYSNTIYKNGTEYFNDSLFTNYACDYETSSIRTWLNNDFYNTAFTEKEKQEIITTNLSNNSYYTLTGISRYENIDSGETKDKVFLLSYEDVLNSNYGFSSDEKVNDIQRKAYGTDYAKCQGLYVDKNESKDSKWCSHWLLRSPNKSSAYCCGVTSNGDSYHSFTVCDTYYGIRPALKFARVFDDSNTEKQVTTGYKREHVVDNWKALNQSYKSEYLAGFAVPMDGINGNPDYLIPGQSENMIPQGLAYWPEKDWVLVSSYDKNVENPSAIFALDRETGAFVAQFNMYTKDGKAWKPHAGGIGVSEHNLYITCDSGVAYFPLSDLDVPSGTVKDITRADYMIVPYLYNAEEPDETAYTAYVSVSEGMLWTGNFYSNSTASQILGGLLILPKNWYWEATEDSDSIIVGYKLSGNNSKDEWTNLKNSSHAAKHIITVDDSIDCIQGISFKKISDNTYNMYLSRTTDESFSASISFASVTLNKNEIYLYEEEFKHFVNLPGTEGITFIGNDLYAVYESGALGNCDDLVSQVSWSQYFKDCTDVIWKVNESDLLDSTRYKGLTTAVNGIHFEEDSINYNHNLGRFCSLFTVIGYDSKATITENLMNCGFTVEGKYIVTNAAQEQVNNFITHKKVLVNGKEYTLVFAGYIGSHKKQWYSNFDPGRGETHKGFINAKNYVYQILENYIKSLGVSKDETIILLTGHSRGAAVSNLVAKQLIDDEKYATKEKVFTYSFATPNSTSLSERKNDKYKRIFNIVNPEDLVTKMIPADWGYGRYGETYTLPSKTNDSQLYTAYKTLMNEKYKLLLNGESYHPYPGGEEQTYNVIYDLTSNVKNINQFYDKNFCWLNTWTTIQEFITNTLCTYLATDGEEKDNAKNLLIKTYLTTIINSKLISSLTNYFVNYQGWGAMTGGLFMDDYFQEAHQPETYCAYMMSMTKEQLQVERKTYNGTINCPVDIEIYDKETGELVGRIVDNVVDEEIASKENSVVMSVDGDSKSFWLPSNGDYDIKLIGNDEGTMDYTMGEVDSDIGEVKRVNFFDVEITDGLTMTADVEGEDFVIEEHELTFEDGETLEPTEIFTEKDIETYDINISASKGGSASSSQTAKSGDYVSLDAVAEDGWKFIGWYENDELISTDTTLTFVAKSDRSLEAKFEHIDHSFNDWYEVTPATCETSGTEQRDCS